MKKQNMKKQNMKRQNMNMQQPMHAPTLRSSNKPQIIALATLNTLPVGVHFMKKQYPMKRTRMRHMMITRTMAIFVIVPLFCSLCGTGFAFEKTPNLAEVTSWWKGVDESVPTVESEDVGVAEVGGMWKQRTRIEMSTSRRNVLRLEDEGFMMSDDFLVWTFWS